MIKFLLRIIGSWILIFYILAAAFATEIFYYKDQGLIKIRCDMLKSIERSSGNDYPRLRESNYNNYSYAKYRYLNAPVWRIIDTNSIQTQWEIFTPVCGPGIPPLELKARNSYISFDTSFLNEELLEHIAKINLKLEWSKKYQVLDWEPQIISFYRQDWTPLVLGDWNWKPHIKDWTGGIFITSININTLSNSIAIDIPKEMININGETQFRITNKAQQLALLGYNTWPPEIKLGWNRCYQQRFTSKTEIWLFIYIDSS